MNRSGDQVLCPVSAWVSVTRCVLSYPGTNKDSQVNTIFIDNKISIISLSSVRTKLLSAVNNIGIDKLGFKGKDIGRHSVRSEVAMEMYLAKIPNFSIMMTGRRSSDAFLKYIRK